MAEQGRLVDGLVLALGAGAAFAAALRLIYIMHLQKTEKESSPRFPGGEKETI